MSSFEELLPDGQELLVETKTVDELRSMAFLSQKDGSYQAVPLPERMQWMKVQDMRWDNTGTQLYYVGSNAELVAVRGNSMSARVGLLGQFDAAAQQFSAYRWLDFPIGLQARAAVPLQNGKLLIVTNNNYP
ncbi:hypothetical protein RZS08_18975, partial [Arthrospira platensis SPKY1]|nr:hypothetical protein [Arthrospira platensis SPKY1]